MPIKLEPDVTRGRADGTKKDKPMREF